MRKRLQRRDDFLTVLSHTKSKGKPLDEDEEFGGTATIDTGTFGRAKKEKFLSQGEAERLSRELSVRDSEESWEDDVQKRATAPRRNPRPTTETKKTVRNSIAAHGLSEVRGQNVKSKAAPGKKRYWSCSSSKDLHLTSRSVLQQNVLGLYTKGESFGEVSLLYNAPQIATAVAVQDSSVWCVSQAAFRRIMINESNRKLEQIASYLDKVDVLQGLLSHEKQEIAKNFLTLSFNEGDYIVRQNEELFFWYILIQGECTMSRMVDNVQTDLATLRSPQYFGERALLRKQRSDFSVQVTSAKGARCLVLDEQTFQDLIESDDPAFQRALDDDWRDFAKYKDNATDLQHKAVGMVGKMKEAAALKRMDEIVRRRSSRLSVFSRNSSVVLDPEMFKRTLQRIGVLGAGAFGLVTLERDPATNDLYALKTLSKTHIMKCQAQNNVIDEREILSMVDSPFIIRMFCTWKDNNYIYFVFEPALGGELHTLLHKNPAFRQVPVCRYALACIVLAIIHLHERQILFRDLKPENILMSKDGVSKLCDFGFAKFVTSRTMTICGTPDYLAPEVLSQEGYDRMVDWWAVGVLVFEVLSKRTPFSETDEEDEVLGIFTNIRAGISNVSSVSWNALESSSREGADLSRRLLHADPTQRLGFARGQQVMQHSFFSPVDWQKLAAGKLDAPYKAQLKAEDDLSAFQPEEDESDVPEFEPYEDDGSNWDAVFNG